jgi:hypothetical protein
MSINRPMTHATPYQAGTVLPASRVTFIPLPVNSMQSSVASAFTSPVVTIANDSEGEVAFRHNYWSESTVVTIEIRLRFAPGSACVPHDVSMALHPDTFMVEFSPAIERFPNDVILSASASNLDLSGVPDNTPVYLFFITESGCEIVDANPVHIDKTGGSLTLASARLAHFSLYGFGFVK